MSGTVDKHGRACGPNGYALITGASSGIGRATAFKLASNGYDLILVGRRLPELEEVQKKCHALGAKQTKTRTLDIRSKEEVATFFSDPWAESGFERLSVLVNNAGLASGVDPLPTAKIEDWETMVETNLMGLLYMTRGALPMITQNRGHVVNVGSVAGVWTYPGGGVYCATKAAVKAISEGLRMDMQGSGVRVTNIEPGKVETDFSRVRYRDEARAKKEYEGYTPLSAEDIAECIHWSISRPPHMNVQEMIVFPTAQAGISLLHRE